MGNSNTKEAREPLNPRASRASPPSSGPPDQLPQGFPGASSSSSRQRNRASRSDLSSLLGMSAGGGPSSQTPHERRETRQEREARRLERERQARLIERERSLAEEHVDGGYLVTLGTYVGPEDYSKPTVRQLQIERKLAPFWRGLNDFSPTTTEPQIIAVARGLPLPAADETPTEELMPRPLPVESPSTSQQNLNNLTVPLGGRTQSVASDKSASGRGSVITSPTSAGAPTARSSSPFKHRPKALAAALSITSRNGSTTEIAPREVRLPHDPFVNGQPLEVALYKDASECPICFLYYPPYLNHTRCCDQPICSECFVQIKRADPHYPEGHGDGEQTGANPADQAGLLISEPACCPYCQLPELGVTYEPPPFRRGLVFSSSGPAGLGVGALGTAMSSSSSLNSSLSPTSITSPPSGPTPPGRRRTQSLSANAPNVITTDRVRPDWATKLAAQRAHIARRAAAATALHTAAFLMGNADSRPFRVGMFTRRNTGGSPVVGPGAPLPAGASPGGLVAMGGDPGALIGAAGAGAAAGGGGAGEGDGSGNRAMMGRRSRMEDLEDMMLAEAIRLSLAAEEERKRKAEKEERKEAKRKEKEERKAAKAAAKASGSGAAGPYGGSSGHSSAGSSSLSLPGLGIGRRRGNSVTSNLRVEASVASAMAASAMVASSAGGAAMNPTDKGKAVERPDDKAAAGPSGDQAQQQPSSSSALPTEPTPASGAAAQPTTSPPNRPVGPSHLRQMSSASSATSSATDNTPAGSYTGLSQLAAGDPRASGLSLGGHGSEEGAGNRSGDDRDPSTSTEPMFNFNSLAQMVGVQLEGEHAGRRLSAIDRASADAGANKDGGAVAEHEDRAEPSNQGGSADDKTQSPAAPAVMPPPAPEVTVTPGTPAPDDTDRFEDPKRQLGFHETTVQRHDHTTKPNESAG